MKEVSPSSQKNIEAKKKFSWILENDDDDDGAVGWLGEREKKKSIKRFKSRK